MIRPTRIQSGPTTRAPGWVPSAITQATNERTAPSAEVSGIRRPRIHTFPRIRNGLGMSGSEIRSQMIDACVIMKASRIPKLYREARVSSSCPW